MARMSLIDRYVLKTFLSGFVILLAVFIGLYIVTDLMVNIDDFLEHSASLPQLGSWVIDYYGHNLPLYFAQLCGPLMALAGAFTFGIMLRNNELTAMIAAGMPLQRLIVPLLLGAAIVIGLWVAARELAIPSLASKIARDRQDIAGVRTEGVYCVRDASGAILTALRLLSPDGQLEQVYIVEPHGPDEPATLVQADAAEYDAQAGLWRLDRGRRITFDPPASGLLEGETEFEPLDAYAFQLTPDQLRLRQSSQWSELLSLREYNALLASPALANRPMLVMGRHVRLTQPMLQVVLLLLAVPFFLTREPTHVLAAGGKALLLAGLLFVIAFGVHNLSVDERWSALLAWIPILAFAPVAVLSVANVKT
jgi:lipopolysaccharide export system permease protein